MKPINLIYPKKGKLIDSLNDEPLSKEFLENLKKATKISKKGKFSNKRRLKFDGKLLRVAVLQRAKRALGQGRVGE